MTPSLLLLIGLSVASGPQDELARVEEAAPVSPGAPAVPDAEPASPSLGAAELRERVHEMRMNLLLGGERVRAAEGEAIGFYGGKIEVIEQRMDGIGVELAEKRAGYDIELARTLDAPDEAKRRAAVTTAARLRREIGELEAESTALGGRRKRISGLVTAVEARDRERQRLVAKLETSGEYEEGMGLPLASIGLAPNVPEEVGSPLEDEELVQDLLQRDELRARRRLFEWDPEGYWQRFPLTPPAATLLTGMTFPLPDLPGER